MEVPIPVLDVMTDDLEPRSMAAEQLISGQPRMASRDLYRAGQAILIRAGSRCTWEIEEPVRMLLHYRAADDPGEQWS